MERGKVVVMCGGVGYVVNMAADELVKIKAEDEFGVYVYTHVKEDEIALYGFKRREKRVIFERLLSVSGVGPKLALNALNTGTPDEIVKAVNQGEVEFFTAVSGIGKKNAQRIIVELQNKLGGVLESELDLTPESDELLQALLSLGFNKREIVEVSKKIDSGLPIEQQVKQALRNLS